MASAIHTDAAISRRPTGWIISPLADITLLVATPLAIVPIVYLTAQHLSADLIALAVTSFASIGHHLPGFMRAYGDRELFGRFRWRFLLAPPLVLATALLFASRKLHGLELIVLTWATWHIVMQTYGLMRIYDLKRGIRDATSARLDFGVCVAVFLAGILFSQTRLYPILEEVGRVGIPLGPPATIDVLRWALGLAIGIVLLGYAIRVLIQTRAEGPSWAKIALLLTTGWLYWICGSLSTNLLIGVAMFDIFHAAQYNAIVWSYNRRLADRVGDRFGPLRFLFGKGGLPLAMYAAVIVAYGSINWFTDGIVPSSTKTILLTFLLTSTTLHFYYDGFIWKVSERGTQQNLGIESGGQRAYAVPGLIHATKWAGLAAIAAGLFWIESAGAERTADDERAWVATLSQWTPDLPEPLVRESQLALAQGDITGAIDAAERAVQLRPGSAEAQAALGGSLLHADRYKRAATALRQAVALAPSVWENHQDLALALAHLDQWADAEQQFEIAASQRPQNGKLQKAWAEMCERRGAVGPALMHYRAALALDSESLATRIAIVPLLIRTGATTEALRIAETAVERDAASSDAQALLARSLVAKLDFKAANEAAKRAVALAPDSADANYQLGFVNVLLRDFPTAESALQQSLAANPNYAPSHLQLGYVYFLTQRLELAEQSFRRSIVLAPGSEEAHRNLGAVLFQQGQLPEAKQALLDALEIAPDNAVSHYNLGLVLLRQGDMPNARLHLQRAERLGQRASPEVRRDAGLD